MAKLRVRGRRGSPRRRRGTAPSRPRPLSVPSRSAATAQCTWPIEAAVIGTGSPRRTAIRRRAGRRRSPRRPARCSSAGRSSAAWRASPAGLGQSVVDVAGHLAEFISASSAQPCRHVLGRAQLEVGVELLPALCRGQRFLAQWRTPPPTERRAWPGPLRAGATAVPRASAWGTLSKRLVSVPAPRQRSGARRQRCVGRTSCHHSCLLRRCRFAVHRCWRRSRGVPALVAP